jgi:hypothetical protein
MAATSAALVGAPGSSDGPRGEASLEATPSTPRVIGAATAWEPSIAVDPANAGHLAATYEAFVGGAVVTLVRFSQDGGVSWHNARRMPWSGSGRLPQIHPVLAWGSGPGGRPRVYWTGMTSAGAGSSLSVAYSDDEGATWSPLYVERRTPSWVGGFPTIATDENPASPGYGHVYIAYNWPRGEDAPGLHLLASADYGRTWADAEVPPAPASTTDHWRIGYKVASAPDGSIYVAAFQVDMPNWSSADLFSRRGAVRMGYTVTRVTFDTDRGQLDVGATQLVATLSLNNYTVLRQPLPGMAGTFADPGWQEGLAVAPYDGTVYLAVGDLRDDATPRGVVRVYRSADEGATWDMVELSPAPAVGGRPVTAYKPVLVAAPGGVVWVGFHTLTDLPVGTSSIPTVGEAYALSGDDGRSFSVSTPLHARRWPANRADHLNGPGLRDQAVLGPDGRIVYAFGSGLDVGRTQSTVVDVVISLVRHTSMGWPYPV